MMKEMRMDEIMAVNGGSTPRQDDRNIMTDQEGRRLAQTIVWGLAAGTGGAVSAMAGMAAGYISTLFGERH